MRAVVYTDGSVYPNPGPTGSAAVLEVDGELVRARASRATGTNQTAELAAVGLALAILPASEATSIVIVTDSKYVIGCLTGAYKIKSNAPQIAALVRMLKAWPQLTFEWVKGHKGHPGNELADKLAGIARKTYEPNEWRTIDDAQLHKLRAAGPAKRKAVARSRRAG